MQQPPPLPRHMEIANLEHRLTRLREQEQAFARQSDLLKRATWIALPVLAVVVTVLAFTTQRDPVPMLALFAILIVATAVVAWIFRHADWRTSSTYLVREIATRPIVRFLKRAFGTASDRLRAESAAITAACAGFDLCCGA